MVICGEKSYPKVSNETFGSLPEGNKKFILISQSSYDDGVFQFSVKIGKIKKKVN
jgi:hypothetical protein